MLTIILLVALTNRPAVVNQKHVDELWVYVSSLIGGVGNPADPMVYFTSDSEPKNSPSFLGYYYDHTNIIRIGPSSKFKAYGVGEQGLYYQTLAHEMIHYLLYKAGIPIEAHHCLMARQNYSADVDSWLLGRGRLTISTYGAVSLDVNSMCSMGDKK